MKFVGERRALAAAVMAFYAVYTFLIASSGVAGPMSGVFAALTGVYGLAFFGLVAGYFWARWYAVGVGLFGLIFTAVAIWKEGLYFPITFIGWTHLLATLMLWGTAMSGPFDGQTAWRERFHMDESAVQRLGRSVIRAGVSLPFILMYAFTPKQGAGELAAIAAVGLALVGFRGMLKLRTWGVLAIGAAGASTLALGAAQGALLPLVGGALLVAAAAPFARPMIAHVRAAR
jgi:hypothetical protein